VHLLEAIPLEQPITSLSLEKPAEAMNQYSAEVPESDDWQNWLDYLIAVSEETGAGQTGLTTLLDGFAHDEESEFTGVYGIEPAQIESAVSTGADAPMLVLAGDFDADAVEAALGLRWGPELGVSDESGIPYFTWPVGDDRTDVPPLLGLDAMALIDDLAVLAESPEVVDTMVQASKGGENRADDEELVSVVTALENAGSFAGNVSSPDSEVIYERAMQWLDEAEASGTDPTAGVREVEEDEYTALRIQTVLLPYSLLGVGWRDSKGPIADAIFPAMFVFLNESASDAEENASRFKEILTTGRSVMNLAPWSEHGFGDVIEARSDDRLSVVFVDGSPRNVEGALSRSDMLFASRRE
jgi:hypothetical protein